MLSSLVFLFVLLLSQQRGAHAAAKKNLTRTICYSGSLMYQQITQVCEEQDSSYKGTWYCAKTEVCESFISPNRECMTTKGCAKEEQCWTGGAASSGSLYDGSIPLVTLSGSKKPGGMKITPLCCLNSAKFPTDDATISWAPGVICNSATRRMAATWGWGLMGLLALYLAGAYRGVR